jgi:hypothetical protein
MGGHGSHRGNGQGRVVDGDQGSLPKGRARPASVVVEADDIGQEHAIEEAALERPCEVEPERKSLAPDRPVARMPPKAGRLVNDAAHVEAVEADRLGHLSGLPAATGGGPADQSPRRRVALRWNSLSSTSGRNPALA